MVDFIFVEQGSIVTVQCMNPPALAHLREHTSEEAIWTGNVLVGEPRYAPDLSGALCRDGFIVRLPNGRVVTAEDLRK